MKLSGRYTAGVIVHINPMTAQNGALVRMEIEKFKPMRWQSAADTAFDPKRTVEQNNNKRAVLFKIADDKAWFLGCYYRLWTSGGRSSEPFYYWFQTRPDLADPEYLNAIGAARMVAAIGRPRASCPDPISSARAAGGKVSDLRVFDGPP